MISHTQHFDLTEKYGQTGAGKIPDEEQLTELEDLALAYAGVEAITGKYHLTQTHALTNTRSHFY